MANNSEQFLTPAPDSWSCMVAARICISLWSPIVVPYCLEQCNNVPNNCTDRKGVQLRQLNNEWQQLKHGRYDNNVECLALAPVWHFRASIYFLRDWFNNQNCQQIPLQILYQMRNFLQINIGKNLSANFENLRALFSLRLLHYFKKNSTSYI